MDNKKSITISQIYDLIVYEIYNLVVYVRADYRGQSVTTCAIIHNETELSIFIDIFGDAEIVSLEGDANVVIANILFKPLNKTQLLEKVNEYNHRVYL